MSLPSSFRLSEKRSFLLDIKQRDIGHGAGTTVVFESVTLPSVTRGSIKPNLVLFSTTLTSPEQRSLDC
jgi:hypothetical protein